MALENVIIPVLTGIIGAGASLAGVYFAQSKRQKRWYADYFLQEKVKTIIDLQEALTKSKRQVIRYSQKEIQTEQESNEIIEAFHDYSEAMDRATIFIDSSTLEDCVTFYNTFLSMIRSDKDYTASHESVDLSNESMEKFLSDYDGLLYSLENELNSPIKHVDKIG